MPAERNTEGAGRAITDTLRYFGDAPFFALEKILGDFHAPGEQIFHRRHAHDSCETLKEAGSRKSGGPGELGDG